MRSGLGYFQFSSHYQQPLDPSNSERLTGLGSDPAKLAVGGMESAIRFIRTGCP